MCGVVGCYLTLAGAASALCVEQKKPLGSTPTDLVNQIICIKNAKRIKL